MNQRTFDAHVEQLVGQLVDLRNAAHHDAERFTGLGDQVGRTWSLSRRLAFDQAIGLVTGNLTPDQVLWDGRTPPGAGLAVSATDAQRAEGVTEYVRDMGPEGW